MSSAYNELSPREAHQILEDEPDAILLDVRTPEEYNQGHIQNAILLPLDQINPQSVEEVIPSKDNLVLVYCHSGVRSAQVSEYLARLGYTDVNKFDGVANWPYDLVK